LTFHLQTENAKKIISFCSKELWILIYEIWRRRKEIRCWINCQYR